MFYWKKAYQELRSDYDDKFSYWTDVRNILQSKVDKLEADLGTYKIENEALKEQLEQAKRAIDANSNVISNLTEDRMAIMSAFDAFHRRFMAVYGSYFPVFSHDDD
jgi:chromosome segregation ATPase